MLETPARFPATESTPNPYSPQLAVAAVQARLSLLCLYRAHELMVIPREA